MAIRRHRVPTVLDTNILVAAFLSRNRRSANVRVYRMWADRRLQLVVSNPIQAEYLALLERIGVSAARVREFAQRLATRAAVTWVRPPRDLPLSRDVSDNMFLAAAVTGKARFLVTNDNDLLQIPAAELRGFRLRIVTPGEFLEIVSRRGA